VALDLLLPSSALAIFSPIWVEPGAAPSAGNLGASPGGAATGKLDEPEPAAWRQALKQGLDRAPVLVWPPASHPGEGRDGQQGTEPERAPGRHIKSLISSKARRAICHTPKAK